MKKWAWFSVLIGIAGLIYCSRYDSWWFTSKTQVYYGRCQISGMIASLLILTHGILLFKKINLWLFSILAGIGGAYFCFWYDMFTFVGHGGFVLSWSQRLGILVSLCLIIEGVALKRLRR